MTLVLTCLTPELIVQASDRRVTRVLANGDIKVEDDERNKAIVYKNVATLAYTGQAELGADKRTDYWILYAINKTPKVGDALRALASSADTDFAERRRRWPAVDAAEWRHAFVLAGWSGPTDDAPIRPYFAAVSNALDADGAWIAKARDSFTVRVTDLPANEEFSVHAAGVAPRPNDLATLSRQIRRALRHGAWPDVIATHLVDAIRHVSGWSGRVGKSVLVVSIPKVSLGRAGGVLVRGDDVIDRVALSSVYYPKDATQPERYGPHFIYPQGFIMGEPVLLPPGDPEHGQEEPPWLAGPIVLSRRVMVHGTRRPLIVAKLEQDYPGIAAGLYAEFRRRAAATPTPCAFRLNGPVVEHERLHASAQGLRHARATDWAAILLILPTEDAVGATLNRGLARDALDRAPRDTELLRYRTGLDPGIQKLLNRVAIQHAEHPPRASGNRDVSSHRERPNETGRLSAATEFREKVRHILENAQQS